MHTPLILKCETFLLLPFPYVVYVEISLTTAIAFHLFSPSYRRRHAVCSQSINHHDPAYVYLKCEAKHPTRKAHREMREITKQAVRHVISLAHWEP